MPIFQMKKVKVISLVLDRDCTSGPNSSRPPARRTGCAVEPSLGSPGMTTTSLSPIQGQGIPQALISGWFLENDRFFFFLRCKVHFHSQLGLVQLVDDSLLWLLYVFADFLHHLWHSCNQ